MDWDDNHLGSTKVGATCSTIGTSHIIALLSKDRISGVIVVA